MTLARDVAMGTWAASIVVVLAACGADDRPAVASTSSSSSSTSSSSSSSGGGALDGDVDASTSSGESSGGSGDAGPDASLDDGSPPGPACAETAREGPEVGEIRIAQDPPPAMGGTLVPGKYFLTTWETYTGAGGAAGPSDAVRTTTLIVTASQLTFAIRDVEEAADLPVRVESFQGKGTTLESVETCPLEGRPLTRNFTAAPTELVLLEPFGVITRRLVFTKQ